MQLELTAGNLKAGMAAAGAKSADLWNVPEDELVVMDGFNARDSNTDEYKAAVRRIADSIHANGYYRDQPLGVFPRDIKGKSTICVFQGNRRLAGARLAISEGCEKMRDPKTGRNVLPCVSQPNGTTMEDLTVKLVMTVQTVKSHLTLAGAPQTVKKMVKAGTVSGSNAVKAVKKHGSEATKALQEGTEKAASRGKTRATAKDLEGPKAAVVGLAKAVLNLATDFPHVPRTTEWISSFEERWFAIVEMAKVAA